MEHIGIVVAADARVGLGGKVEALLQRVNKHVDQRIYHKHAQKRDGRQQIQPRLPIVFLHTVTSLSKGFPISIILSYPVGQVNPNDILPTARSSLLCHCQEHSDVAIRSFPAAGRKTRPLHGCLTRVSVCFMIIIGQLSVFRLFSSAREERFYGQP